MFVHHFTNLTFMLYSRYPYDSPKNKGTSSHHVGNNLGLSAVSVCTISEAAMTLLTNTDYNYFLNSDFSVYNRELGFKL